MRAPRIVGGAAAAALALALTLTACSSSGSSAGAPSTSGRASGSTPESTAVVAAAASFGALAARLVTRVPVQFQLQKDSVGNTGPSDLAKAIQDDGTPGAEKALRAEGFVRGYQRLWAGPQDAEIIVYVYQFKTKSGAAQDFTRDTAALHAEAPKGATTFSVRGIPPESSLALAGTSSDVSAAIVLFTLGPYNVQVISHGPTLPALPVRAATLALDQYQRLQRAA